MNRQWNWKTIFQITPLKITLLAVAVAVALFVLDVRFFKMVELKTLDLRLLSRGEIKPGPETVIAAIDEKSLAELGRWPWPRATLAALVDQLSASGAKVIAFDIVFAEPDANIALSTLDGLTAEIRQSGILQGALNVLLNRRKAAADMDAALALSIGKAKNVTLGYFFHFPSLGDPNALNHLSKEKIALDTRLIENSRYPGIQMFPEADDSFLPRAFAPQANLPVISDAARNSGYFNTLPDADGSNRWSPLVVAFDQNYYASLAVASIHAYLDLPPLSLSLEHYGASGIRIGENVIPTDESGRLLINYLGPARTFPHHSVTDILSGKLPPETFRDKIVLIGATAAGIYDLRVTPFSAAFPGVEIHATVIDNILHKRYLLHSSLMRFFDLCAIIFFGLAMGLAVSRLRPLPGLFTALALVAAFVGINFFVFLKLNVWLNLVYPFTTMILIYLGVTVIHYFTEEREKKKIRDAFQYYLTASVINEMLKDPSKLRLGGEKRALTVLFSDIRGFTAIAETLTPEELVALLNEYLTVMTKKVFAHDGLLDKYMGDAIMAVYGAPIDQPDHAHRACLTALEMIRALGPLREKWQEEGRAAFDIGIGISTGEMVVGNMGSQMRFDYTVMGDRVNLGSRLEGLNKEYGTRIIISEFTYLEVKETMCCRELDRVRVQGKSRSVTIYELLGEKKEEPQFKDFICAFEQGLASYRKGQWDEAADSFAQVIKIKPGDYASMVYLERCRKLKENPPAKPWDAVLVMTAK
ncbi:MAG: adenylate/guanylate cyclase domain-containing protein [Smithellaceae bacterium]